MAQGPSNCERSHRGETFLLAVLERLERDNVTRNRAKVSRLQAWIYGHGVYEYPWREYLASGWTGSPLDMQPAPHEVKSHDWVVCINSSVLNIASWDYYDILPTYTAAHELGHLLGVLRHLRPNRYDHYVKHLAPAPGTSKLYREELRASRLGVGIVKHSRIRAPLHWLLRFRWYDHLAATQAFLYSWRPKYMVYLLIVVFLLVATLTCVMALCLRASMASLVVTGVFFIFAMLAGLPRRARKKS